MVFPILLLTVMMMICLFHGKTFSRATKREDVFAFENADSNVLMQIGSSVLECGDAFQTVIDYNRALLPILPF